ncbi:MAG: hypothetical protein MUP58_01400 [Candidatus Nanohaloarchaeota archaeon QJJ-9]|nr:hypothetical protein [Candidatus Nanohaloarchaeota archaeon QJJ-9]
MGKGKELLAGLILLGAGFAVELIRKAVKDFAENVFGEAGVSIGSVAYSSLLALVSDILMVLGGFVTLYAIITWVYKYKNSGKRQPKPSESPKNTTQEQRGVQNRPKEGQRPQNNRSQPRQQQPTSGTEGSQAPISRQNRQSSKKPSRTPRDRDAKNNQPQAGKPPSRVSTGNRLSKGKSEQQPSQPRSRADREKGKDDIDTRLKKLEELNEESR